MITTTVHTVESLDEGVRDEILRLTRPWYDAKDGVAIWRLPRYCARKLLHRAPRKREPVSVVLARDEDGPLVGWLVIRLRALVYTIVNTYVAEGHRGQGISGDMIEAFKTHVGDAPLLFAAYTASGDATAERHSLTLKVYGKR